MDRAHDAGPAQRLQEFARRPQSPLAWAELTPRLLEIAGWPGARPLASSEFQAHRRWQQTIDDCASLGFDGRRIEWSEFLAALDRALNETLFAPESQDAPILIAGPARVRRASPPMPFGFSARRRSLAGQRRDASPLPIGVQREAGMPHASPQLDWELAGAITRRLLASAPEVHFSYARQSDGPDSAGAAARPSRLIVQIAGPPAAFHDLIAPPLPPR